MDYFSIQLGMSSSQLTFTPSFFRGVGKNHQPVKHKPRPFISHPFVWILYFPRSPMIPFLPSTMIFPLNSLGSFQSAMIDYHRVNSSNQPFLWFVEQLHQYHAEACKNDKSRQDINYTTSQIPGCFGCIQFIS